MNERTGGLVHEKLYAINAADGTALVFRTAAPESGVGGVICPVHGLSVSELRKVFCRGKFPDYIKDNDLQDLVLSVLDLSRKGLERRGLNEQHFFAPLYDRALRKSNPALDFLKSLENGLDVREIVLSYAKIDHVKCHQSRI